MPGLEINVANSTVKGLVINCWSDGINLLNPDATGNKVVSNYIGTDVSGTKVIGTESVTTDASGNVTFVFSPTQRVGVGGTVTATDPADNTSEFSAARTVEANMSTRTSNRSKG